MDRNTAIATFVPLAVIVGILLFWRGGGGAETEVRAAVEGFGEALQNVSLLAPESELAASMDQNYAAFVSPTLLEEWKNDPSSALGRKTSSPWPDRIEVDSVERETANRYVAEGEIVEVANAATSSAPTEVARTPLSLILAKVNGSWLIIEAETGPSEAGSPDLTETFDGDDFSLAYPADWTIEEGPGLGGRYLVSAGAETIVRIGFPEDAFDGTDFSEGYLVVSRSSDPAAVAGCIAYTDLQGMRGPAREPVEINGATFAPQTTSNAGAGNFYDSRLYRTVRDGSCHEIALTVHTTNIANYPEGTVTEFDESQAFEPLEDILLTFTFR